MLKKYAVTLQRHGVDLCSSQILAEVLERFPKTVTGKQLAKKTGKSDQYIQNKVKAMQQRDIPVKIKNGKQQPYVQTSLFEPVSWILKEK